MADQYTPFAQKSLYGTWYVPEEIERNSFWQNPTGGWEWYTIDPNSPVGSFGNRPYSIQHLTDEQYAAEISRQEANDDGGWGNFMGIASVLAPAVLGPMLGEAGLVGDSGLGALNSFDTGAMMNTIAPTASTGTSLGSSLIDNIINSVNPETLVNNALKNAGMQLATTGDIDPESLLTSSILNPISSGLNQTLGSIIDTGSSLLDKSLTNAITGGTSSLISGGDPLIGAVSGGLGPLISTGVSEVTNGLQNLFTGDGSLDTMDIVSTEPYTDTGNQSVINDVTDYFQTQPDLDGFAGLPPVTDTYTDTNNQVVNDSVTDYFQTQPDLSGVAGLPDIPETYTDTNNQTVSDSVTEYFTDPVIQETLPPVETTTPTFVEDLGSPSVIETPTVETTVPETPVVEATPTPEVPVTLPTLDPRNPNQFGIDWGILNEPTTNYFSQSTANPLTLGGYRGTGVELDWLRNHKPDDWYQGYWANQSTDFIKDYYNSIMNPQAPVVETPVDTSGFGNDFGSGSVPVYDPSTDTSIDTSTIDYGTVTQDDMNAFAGLPPTSTDTGLNTMDVVSTTPYEDIGNQQVTNSVTNYFDTQTSGFDFKKELDKYLSGKTQNQIMSELFGQETTPKQNTPTNYSPLVNFDPFDNSGYNWQQLLDFSGTTQNYDPYGFEMVDTENFDPNTGKKPKRINDNQFATPQTYDSQFNQPSDQGLGTLYLG